MEIRNLAIVVLTGEEFMQAISLTGKVVPVLTMKDCYKGGVEVLVEAPWAPVIAEGCTLMRLPLQECQARMREYEANKNAGAYELVGVSTELPYESKGTKLAPGQSVEEFCDAYQKFS